MLPKLLTPDFTVSVAAAAKPCAFSFTLPTVWETFWMAPETVSFTALAMLPRLQKCGLWPSFTREWKVCTAFHRWLDPRAAR